ncbi:MAG: TadE/TadG family type IV pilus assembly protein [Gammaproteobacteria bacterium]
MNLYPYSRARGGQAMVEFLIVLPLLLLLILGTLQFAFIYHAKITLNYAAFEAARAGSLNKMRDYAMEYALARSLAPIYTHDADIDKYKEGRAKLRQQIEDGYMRIEIVNPSPEAFANFGINEGGKTSIPNDNLIYRGTPADATAPTIQDANLLKIQVYYCYEMIVPFVNKIIWAMMRYSPSEAMPNNMPQVDPEHRFGAPAAGTFNEECIKTKHDNDDYYGIPIRAQGIMRMQSPAEMPPATI